MPMGVAVCDEIQEKISTSFEGKNKQGTVNARFCLFGCLMYSFVLRVVEPFEKNRGAR